MSEIDDNKGQVEVKDKEVQGSTGAVTISGQQSNDPNLTDERDPSVISGPSKDDESQNDELPLGTGGAVEDSSADQVD